MSSLEVVKTESRIFPPPAAFAAQATVSGMLPIMPYVLRRSRITNLSGQN